MRTQARVTAFKVIFISLFQTTQNEEFIKNSEIFDYICKEEKINNKESDFAYEIIDAFFLNSNEIKLLVDKSLTRYKLQRVYKIDLALIYLAITEFKFLKTPKPVAINEVLEIAKLYSTDKSSSFINGILAKII